jgi:hypothetical protein
MPEPDVLPELDPPPDPDIEPPEGLLDELPVPESVALPDELPAPESILPVAAPPRSPLLLCVPQLANANAPAISGMTKIWLFIVTSLGLIVADEDRLTTREDTLQG